jgi:hypothetical protein
MPKQLSPPKHRLYNITQVGGGQQVIAAPATSRVTIFGGVATGNAVVRIYLGNRLIGFFPNVTEYYEIGQVLHHPKSLPIAGAPKYNATFADITVPDIEILKYLKGQTK